MHDWSGLCCSKDAVKPNLIILSSCHLACRLGEEIPTCCNPFDGKFRVAIHSK